MIGSNGKEQTPLEYRETFKDVLAYKCKQTFNTDEDDLVFITVQPDRPIMCQFELQALTNSLFKECSYVEVLELTYRISKRDRTGQFLDGYHSHILMRESEYNQIKHTLTGKDIVGKVVWCLEGLTDRYLIKQVGVTYIRDYLPINFIPLKESVSTEQKVPSDQQQLGEETIFNVINVLRTLLVKVAEFFRFFLISDPIHKCFKKINKIDIRNMFIDDT